MRVDIVFPLYLLFVCWLEYSRKNQQASGTCSEHHDNFMSSIWWFVGVKTDIGVWGVAEHRSKGMFLCEIGIFYFADNDSAENKDGDNPRDKKDDSHI